MLSLTRAPLGTSLLLVARELNYETLFQDRDRVLDRTNRSICVNETGVRVQMWSQRKRGGSGGCYSKHEAAKRVTVQINREHHQAQHWH